jgi:hypothetical protein
MRGIMTPRDRLTIPAICATLLAALAACSTPPHIRSQSAPDLDIGLYRTYGFVDRPATDTQGYTSLTTRYLKDAVNREMTARGYTLSANPDLLINFNIMAVNKVEGSYGPGYPYGYGYGYGWWRHGYGWGAGVSDWDTIRTYTEGTLTIDVVDHSHNALVWSGSAVGELTKSALDKPQPAIDDAVARIFGHYPRAPIQAAADQKH